jgi:hypothetical protein
VAQGGPQNVQQEGGIRTAGHHGPKDADVPRWFQRWHKEVLRRYFKRVVSGQQDTAVSRKRVFGSGIGEVDSAVVQISPQ